MFVINGFLMKEKMFVCVCVCLNGVDSNMLLLLLFVDDDVRLWHLIKGKYRGFGGGWKEIITLI